MRSFATVTLLVLAASANANSLRSTHRLQARVGAPFNTPTLDGAARADVDAVLNTWKSKDSAMMSTAFDNGARMEELSKKKDAAGAVAALESDIDSLKAEIAAMEATKQSLSEEEERLSGLIEEHALMQAELHTVRDLATKAEADAAERDQEIATAAGAQESLKIECAAAGAELEKVKADRAALEQEVAKGMVQRKKLAADVDAERKNLAAKEKALADALKNLDAENEKLAATRETAAQAVAVMDGLNSQLDDLKKQLQEARDRADELADADAFIEVGAVDDANICSPKFPTISSLLCLNGKVELQKHEDIVDTADAVVEMLTETGSAHDSTVEKYNKIMDALKALSREMRGIAASTPDLQAQAATLEGIKLKLLQAMEVVQAEVEKIATTVQALQAAVNEQASGVQDELSLFRAKLMAANSAQEDAVETLKGILAKTDELAEKCEMDKALVQVGQEEVHHLRTKQKQDAAEAAALSAEQSKLRSQIADAEINAESVSSALDVAQKELQLKEDVIAAKSSLEKKVAKKQIQVDGAKATVEKLEALK